MPCKILTCCYPRAPEDIEADRLPKGVYHEIRGHIPESLFTRLMFSDLLKEARDAQAG